MAQVIQAPESYRVYIGSRYLKWKLLIWASYWAKVFSRLSFVTSHHFVPQVVFGTPHSSTRYPFFFKHLVMIYMKNINILFSYWLWIFYLWKELFFKKKNRSLTILKPQSCPSVFSQSLNSRINSNILTLSLRHVRPCECHFC